MKEKLKKIVSWLPTAIMFIIIITLVFNIFSDADLLKKDFDASEKNEDVFVETKSRETTKNETEKNTELLKGEENNQNSFSTQGEEYEYLINTNSKKFHYITCKSGQRTKESNRAYHSGMREELIEQGYSPCKSCNP